LKALQDSEQTDKVNSSNTKEEQKKSKQSARLQAK
jgi:hypothetical protein